MRITRVDSMVYGQGSSSMRPFENVDHAADWFDAASISEADRLKIGRLNAQSLFKLKDRAVQASDAERGQK